MKSARIMVALLLCAASLFGQPADGDKIAACRQIAADKECPEEKLEKAYEDIINLIARSDRNAAAEEAAAIVKDARLSPERKAHFTFMQARLISNRAERMAVLRTIPQIKGCPPAQLVSAWCMLADEFSPDEFAKLLDQARAFPRENQLELTIAYRTLLVRQGRASQAVKVLEAFGMDGLDEARRGQYHTVLAQTHLANTRFDGSITPENLRHTLGSYRDALKYMGAAYDTMLDAAQVEYRLGDHEAAAKSVEQILAGKIGDRTKFGALLLRAKIAMSRAEYPVAETILAEADAIENKGGALQDFCEVYAAAAMAQRKFAEAAARVEQAIKSGGKNAERKLAPALANLKKRVAEQKR